MGCPVALSAFGVQGALPEGWSLPGKIEISMIHLLFQTTESRRPGLKKFCVSKHLGIPVSGRWSVSVLQALSYTTSKKKRGKE